MLLLLTLVFLVTLAGLAVCQARAAPQLALVTVSGSPRSRRQRCQPHSLWAGAMALSCLSLPASAPVSAPRKFGVASDRWWRMAILTDHESAEDQPDAGKKRCDADRCLAVSAISDEWLDNSHHTSPRGGARLYRELVRTFGATGSYDRARMIRRRVARGVPDKFRHLVDKAIQEAFAA